MRQVHGREGHSLAFQNPFQSFGLYDDLAARFSAIRLLLEQAENGVALALPISSFLGPEDSYFPKRLKEASVRSILQISFDDLRRAPGMGIVRLNRLVEVLERIAAPSTVPLTEEPDDQLDVQTPSSPSLTSADWARWGAAIRRHGLEKYTIGQVAPALRDVPAALWSRELGSFVSVSLEELESTAGFGPARIASVAAALRSVASAVGDGPCPEHLSLTLLSRVYARIEHWIGEAVRRTVAPSVDEMERCVVLPILSQLECDSETNLASCAKWRICSSGSDRLIRAIAVRVGVSHGRIHQLLVKAAEIVQARWPEGEAILESLRDHLDGLPGSGESLELVKRLLDTFFSKEASQVSLSSLVRDSWQMAVQQRLTPLSEAELLAWLGSTCPSFAASRAMAPMPELATTYRTDSGQLYFFGRQAMDVVLLELFKRAEPVAVAELAALIRDTPRNLSARLERDERILEDESRHIAAGAYYGLERVNRVWIVHLVPEPAVGGTCQITVMALVDGVIHGLLNLGIADATVWGVHRFVQEFVRRCYSASLPERLSPVVLADLLVKHSKGRIRPQRRRRLRWDHPACTVPARGKRGWAAHVVAQARVPMTLRELGELLRRTYQDYQNYSVSQMVTSDDEDGCDTKALEFILFGNTRMPVIAVHPEWKLDEQLDNVSQDISFLVSRIVARGMERGYPKERLSAAPWLVRLVERSAGGRMRWTEDAEELEFDALLEERSGVQGRLPTLEDWSASLDLGGTDAGPQKSGHDSMTLETLLGRIF